MTCTGQLRTDPSEGADGYDDVVVGATRFFPSLSSPQIGAAYVFNGSSSGLGTAPAWRLEGTQPDASFGCSVAAASVNGDAYGDVVVGSFDYENGSYREGGAFLYYGESDTTIPIVMARYRLYNSRTLEHLFTTSYPEYAHLSTVGWTQEGVAHHVLQSQMLYMGLRPIPLYRLYEPGIQQHLWTTDANEYSVLALRGWQQEGVDGHVLPYLAVLYGAVPLYRLAYPSPPLHLWTSDRNEYMTLATVGWIQEGIVGYVLP